LKAHSDVFIVWRHKFKPMKKTRNVLAAALIAAAIIPTIQSCKKGEGDPFISLKSRKARVAGEWTISSLKDESTYSGTSTNGSAQTTNSGNSVTEISGTTFRTNSTETSSNGDVSTRSGTGTADAKATFEKDGTFTLKYSFTNIKINEDGDEYNQNITFEQSGTWNFLGGVEEDYKKKERIVLNVLKEVSSTASSVDGFSDNESYSTTYANGENSQIWHISTLKSKEMVVDGETAESGSDAYSYNYGSGFTGSSSSISTSKGKFTSTLTQD
jgi:hypothetical protein